MNVQSSSSSSSLGDLDRASPSIRLTDQSPQPTDIPIFDDLDPILPPPDPFSSDDFHHMQKYPELEEIPELSHLGNAFQLNPEYLIPYPNILEDNVDGIGQLEPSTFGVPIASPSSFSPSRSPFLDKEQHTLAPPTSYGLFIPHIPQSGLGSGSSTTRPSIGTTLDPHHARSRSSSSRVDPIASRAMLEANSRRRRHPAQFACSECSQTFTALFSLKRHEASHAGDRPFSCRIPGCEQRFYNANDCLRHEKSKKRHQFPAE